VVEVAPLPADFPPPVEAPLAGPDLEEAAGGKGGAPATPPIPQLEVAAPTAPIAPARTPHPLEAWAAPGPRIEPVISRPPPGGGYLNATATALQRLADGEQRVREMIGPGTGAPDG
jgi:hypothetical protein